MIIKLLKWLYVISKRINHSLFSFLLRQSKNRKDINLAGDRDIEWAWVVSQMPTGTGEALDFGCGSANLGLVAAWRKFNVKAIDLQPIRWPYVASRLNFVQGDIFKLSFPKNYFDLIINCSSIEHVGLVGRFGITENRIDGDLEAMQHLKELMKPQGIMLLTFPVGQDAVFLPLHRIYGRKRLPLLLNGYVVDKEEFYIKDEQNRWFNCSKDIALDFQAKGNSKDPLQNVYALGCFVLCRPEE